MARTDAARGTSTISLEIELGSFAIEAQPTLENVRSPGREDGAG